jgi:hypothetical protein
MTTTHLPQYWVAGDDWAIVATLLDEDGLPLDLAAAGTEILWALMSEKFERALDEDDGNITITDVATAECMVHIPSEKTSPLPEGRYIDFIRVVSGGITSTMTTGIIYVSPNPWTAAEIAATQVPGVVRLLRVA